MVRLGIWSGASASSKITAPKSSKEREQALPETVSNSSHSTDSLLADAVGEASPDEVAEIAMDVGTQSMTQEEDWEDLADTKMSPNSSIHILAKSSENVHPNAGHDWVDLKEKPEGDADTGSKRQQAPESNKAQHEFAALKMAQGLLKGELDSTKASAATLTAQLQLETADKQHLSSKLAESESMKSQLEAKIAALMKDKAALEEKVTQASEKYQQLETLPKYCCKGCGIDLAAAKAVVWSECKMGRNNESGMLFGSTVNAERMGKVSLTHLATGQYEMQDVKCAKCSAHLGWTYLKAFNEKNKFKEGSTILYKRLLANVSQ